MKIRAAVLEQFGAPLEVQELDLAEPARGEVLVRLVACGVCHTDLYTASGADPSGYAVPQPVERYLAGDIDVDAFLSHRISLDEVNRGFELMEAQDGIRSVIAFA
jgi:Zn-dependent alcohol dehydrogenase